MSGGNYWIGNERLYQLTNANTCSMQVNLIDTIESNDNFQYTQVTLSNETSGYVITTRGFSGGNVDGFHKFNGRMFSTVDRDSSVIGCSSATGGVGWWFAPHLVTRSCIGNILNANSTFFMWLSVPLSAVWITCS